MRRSEKGGSDWLAGWLAMAARGLPARPAAEQPPEGGSAALGGYRQSLYSNDERWQLPALRTALFACARPYRVPYTAALRA
eukprot:SAG31_NODE_4419_length_3250_cov_2.345922_4_plen_81_part_00